MAKFKMTGYKNPPKHTRFKKGESGNPAGRPKASENITKLIKKILGEKITVKDRQGKIRNMSKFEAMVQNLMTNAVKGDLRSAKTMIDIMQRIGTFNENEGNRQGGGGVLVVPAGLSEEEWEKKYGKEPPPDDAFDKEYSDDE